MKRMIVSAEKNSRYPRTKIQKQIKPDYDKIYEYIRSEGPSIKKYMKDYIQDNIITPEAESIDVDELERKYNSIDWFTPSKFNRKWVQQYTEFPDYFKVWFDRKSNRMIISIEALHNLSWLADVTTGGLGDYTCINLSKVPNRMKHKFTEWEDTMCDGLLEYGLEDVRVESRREGCLNISFTNGKLEELLEIAN